MVMQRRTINTVQDKDKWRWRLVAEKGLITMEITNMVEAQTIAASLTVAQAEAYKVTLTEAIKFARS